MKDEGGQLLILLLLAACVRYKTLYLKEKAWGKPGLSQSNCLVGPEKGPLGLSGEPACPRLCSQITTSYCGYSETPLWKHILGIDAFLQIRHKIQGALCLCCRKVSAFSHNNSSLNRSTGMQSANECPCWGLERRVYWVKFSHWVFPSFELLQLATAKSNGVTLWVQRRRTRHRSRHAQALCATGAVDGFCYCCLVGSVPVPTTIVKTHRAPFVKVVLTLFLTIAGAARLPAVCSYVFTYLLKFSVVFFPTLRACLGKPLPAT